MKFYFCIIAFFAVSANVSMAHKINVFAYIDNTFVVTETRFSNNIPVQGVQITVTDSKTNLKLLSGTADKKGIFKFPVASIFHKGVKPVDILILASSSDGHNAQWTIYSSEVTGPKDTNGTATNTTIQFELKNLQQEVAALRIAVARMSNSRTSGFRDILGGLGYIFGICGLLAWMSTRKQKKPMITVILLAALVLPTTVLAHFGMVLPSSNIVTSRVRQISVSLAFTHPFEQVGMELVKPESFSSYFNGEKTLLTDKLTESTYLKHKSWDLNFRPKRPGVYQFLMTPKPYWEPGEDCFIIHYTKTIIGAFGVEEGWDKPLGLPVEIVALTRPFGAYTGSSFTGQVLKDGKPLAHTYVEIEYLNEGNKLKPKSDFHITQTIKTDSKGLFTITCPRAGWWSMAALTESATKIDSPQGPKAVELGGVLWIRVDDWK